MLFVTQRKNVFRRRNAINDLFTVKKVTDFPVPSRAVTNKTLRGRKESVELIKMIL
jgi:hypothetical protein